MSRSQRRDTATRLYRLAGFALVVVGVAAATPLLAVLGVALALVAGPLAGQAGSRSGR